MGASIGFEGFEYWAVCWCCVGSCSAVGVAFAVVSVAAVVVVAAAVVGLSVIVGTAEPLGRFVEPKNNITHE